MKAILMEAGLNTIWNGITGITFAPDFGLIYLNPNRGVMDNTNSE